MKSELKKYPRVLTIAGSDSGGGAGIQADIKAISATGSYAASAITALTVQNTIGVIDVFPVPVDKVSAQIECVISDIGVDAIKIGMLHSSEVITGIRKTLEVCELPKANKHNIVLDPVMISTSGHRLIEDTAISTLMDELIPMARIITPNIPEAEVLAGRKIQTEDELKSVARFLSDKWNVSVLMKAGHFEGNQVRDWFCNAETGEMIPLPSKKINTANTHGTGCTLSSAFASYLAQGKSLDEAAKAAKNYISRAIESGSHYQIGHGHGPVNHFWTITDNTTC